MVLLQKKTRLNIFFVKTMQKRILINLHNSLFTINFQNLTTPSGAIPQSDVYNLLVFWAL